MTRVRPFERRCQRAGPAPTQGRMTLRRRPSGPRWTAGILDRPASHGGVLVGVRISHRRRRDVWIARRLRLRLGLRLRLWLWACNRACGRPRTGRRRGCDVRGHLHALAAAGPHQFTQYPTAPAVEVELPPVTGRILATNGERLPGLKSTDLGIVGAGATAYIDGRVGGQPGASDVGDGTSVGGSGVAAGASGVAEAGTAVGAAVIVGFAGV